MTRTSPIPLDLCAYGKLPLYEEYLRVRCFRGAAGSYREWIDTGFDCASRHVREPDPECPCTWRLLFFPEGLKDGVVATIRESADRGGARRFPFTVFTTVARRHVSSVSSASVRQSIGVWDELTAISNSVASLGSLAEYREVLGRSALTPYSNGTIGRSVGTGEPESLDPPSIARALCGTEETAARFARLLWEVRAAYRAIASGRIDGHRLPGLRLPLAPGLDTVAQVEAWLGCLETSGFLIVRPSTPVTVAFPAEGEQGGSLWVLRRPPREFDFTMLLVTPAGHLHPEPEEARPEVLGRARFLDAVERELFAGPTPCSGLAAVDLEGLG